MHIHTYPGLIDSHLHLLHMKEKGLDLTRFFGEMEKGNVPYLLDAGVSESNFQQRLELAGSFPGLLFAAGIHPGNSHGRIEERISLIREQLDHPRVVALGEMGLDYYWKDVSSSVQKDFFRAQLALAKERDLPVIIHNREADEDCYDLIKAADLPRGGVMHCYSSHYDFARSILDLGFYISFAGNVTYKKSYDIQATAQRMPLDRMLLETDAPYLSPQARRGKTNHSGYLGYTADFISSLRGISPRELVDKTADNFSALFLSRP